MPEAKFRLFCWTDFIMDASLYDQSKIGFSYFIAGDEICPSTKRKHWQCFMYFKHARSYNRIKKLLYPRHVDACDGNSAQNIKYCSKDKNIVIECGTKPSPGNRTDLAAARDQLMNGETTVDEIALENPTMYHQYGRTLSRIEDIALRRKYRTEMTKGTWLYGPTYTGKSEEQFENFNPDTHYVYPDDNGWWDGYTGQETVIINDFRGCLPYAFLLKLVDKHPMSVRRRGREPAPFLAKHVTISSPHPPKEVYNNLAERDSLDQLYRRFEIYYIPEFGVRLRAFDEMAQKCSEGNTKPLSQKKNMIKTRPKERDVFNDMYLDNAQFS